MSVKKFVARVSLRYERRRYGHKNYTWIYATVNGKEHTLGDPWPCLNPPLKEVKLAIETLFDVEEIDGPRAWRLSGLNFYTRARGRRDT